ncbi:unnamed protein product [Durusdinium trenchii]|uniref:PNPLA domain-containing protein n=1 Tax=Durusdinium trenchii TaxID=1381693 RepID=A0ABP0HDA1_9DINO
MCKSSQCRCKPGFCAVNGICMERTAHVTDTCNRRTGGSCRFLGCSSWRGAVDCIDGACVCQAGYCSADDGSCHKPKPRIKAKVVPVNLQSQVFPAAQVNLRTGVCFSGGGSRALTVTMGVLRALESLKLIPHIDAISSVSGGTWASSIYMFAKDVMTLNGGSNPHDLWIESYAKTVLESLQMSPDFTGSPFYPKDSLVHYKGGQSDREFLVGGGFVESFAFGGSSPLSAQGQMGGDAVEMEAPPTSFSLADAIGISSAAFASVLVSAEEYLPVKDVWPVSNDLLDKFGYAAENPGEYLIYNQVFHADELQPLLCEFQSPGMKKRMASDAMVVQRDLEVLANSKWGIEGNWRVLLGTRSVVFAYLSSPRRFTVNLPPETLQEQLQTAVALSGGGTRAMVAAIGALRGMEELQLMSHVDLLVSVSGGSWTAGPYMFAHMSDKELLGSRTKPSEASLPMSTTYFWFRVTVPLLGPDLLKQAFFNHDDPHGIWVNTFNKILLEPLGLGNTSKYMASDEQSLQRILQNNPHLRREDFILPPIDRPRAFVMLGVLLAPLGHESEDDTVVSLQMSPDFSGSPFYPGGHGNIKYDEESTNWFTRADIPALKMVIGGGMVETFAFGGDTPYDQSGQSGGHGVKMPSPSEPLSLAKAIGVSSAAFTAMISQALNNFGGQTMQALIPVTTMWPITSRTQPGPKAAAKFKIGDGGHMDNSGLLPILQRKVPKVVMFVNTDIPISLKSDR